MDTFLNFVSFLLLLKSGLGHLHQYSYTIIITGRQALKHFYHLRITFDSPWRSDHPRMRKQAWVALCHSFAVLRVAQYSIPDDYRSMSAAVWRGLAFSFSVSFSSAMLDYHRIRLLFGSFCFFLSGANPHLR